MIDEYERLVAVELLNIIFDSLPESEVRVELTSEHKQDLLWAPEEKNQELV